MNYPIPAAASAAIAVLMLALANAQAFDESKYPDLKGQWTRAGEPIWTPAGETAPLTAEYQAIHARNLQDQAAGGHGTDPTWTCLGPGMPRIMNAYQPMEIVVTPPTTYILISNIHDNRRIYTDGRKWPEDLEPAFKGYSIGTWRDTDRDGRFDTLEIETRGLKGPRAFDSTGLPLHADNKTVVKERLHLDNADRSILVDEITTIDNALTRPWTISKTYKRGAGPRPAWTEQICAENNSNIRIGDEAYRVGPDGLLAPAKKDQPPPDLRYFKPAQK
jgi:hypothetical protein